MELRFEVMTALTSCTQSRPGPDHPIAQVPDSQTSNMPPKLVSRVRKRSKDEDKKKASAQKVKALEKSYAEIASIPSPPPPKPVKKLIMVIWHCPMGFPKKVLRGCEDLVADIARANKFDRANIRSVPHVTDKRPDAHLTVDYHDPLTGLWTPAHIYVELDEYDRVTMLKRARGGNPIFYRPESITSAKGTARGGERMR